MKKIFVGGLMSCGVHSEGDMIKSLVKSYSKYEIVNDYKVADVIIIIDTCMSTYNNILKSIDYVESVLRDKKEESFVVVSGCLAREIKFELSDRYKNILNQVTCVKFDNIIEYVAKLIGVHLSTLLLENFKLPYTLIPNGIEVSPVMGCYNHCSFCKSNYMDYSLSSVPYQYLEKMAMDIDSLSSYGLPINYISICASNLSLYGVDLYKKRKCHEAIRMLTSPETIKFTEVGALINWYPELVEEILRNPKIKSVFTSLESGSERIYNLMNRPIKLDKLIEIIKLIRKERPDILINTEFICGYPTETIDDLKRTIDLVYELDVNPQFMHPYCNSLQIPSSKLSQHSVEYCTKSVGYAKEQLIGLRNKFKNFVDSGEMFVIDKDDLLGIYEVMLIDGSIRNIRMDQFDRKYEIDELIPSNMVKCRQLIRRQVNRI